LSYKGWNRGKREAVEPVEMGRGVFVVFGEAGGNAERGRNARAATTLALIATAGLVSCGKAADDTTAPHPAGLLAVGTATAGSDLDPDGYSLTIAGPAHSERSIGDSETARVSLPVGSYSLTLAGVRFNCRVNGANPQHVDVAAAANPPVQFAVGCTERSVASVDIEPRATSLGVGESLPLQATPFDAEVSPPLGSIGDVGQLARGPGHGLLDRAGTRRGARVGDDHRDLRRHAGKP
jgi:hypothetical protein